MSFFGSSSQPGFYRVTVNGRENIELAYVMSSPEPELDGTVAFDVTIRPLVQAWGFGDAARVPGGPEPAELEALRARVGWQRLEVAGAALVKASADLVCDLSAVAKGFAVDAVSRDLALRGHVDHLVEIGGELRARGRRADGEAWRRHR